MKFALLLAPLLLSCSFAAILSDPVLDTEGNELKRGHKYYVLPAIFGPTGGGLKLESVNETCPLNVGREESEVASGLPVMFFPEDPDRPAVLLGATFYAMFAEPTQCPESTVWNLENGRLTTGGYTSSTLGTHWSRFGIQKSEEFPTSAYRIQSCPCSVDVERPSCRMGCSNVDGLPRTVVFVAAGEEASTRSMA